MSMAGENFDPMMLRLQLALLRADHQFTNRRVQVQAIAEALEAQIQHSHDQRRAGSHPGITDG